VILRRIDEPAIAAAANMARDEALLLAGDTAALRLYSWAPHSVSLGYFQCHCDFLDLGPNVPIVRRLTGGGAIFHGVEVTYALALPASALPTDVEASYARIHDAVVVALADVGVAAMRLEVGAAPGARPTSRWCFADPGRHDIVDRSGQKLVGSAQRRVRTPHGPRVLHHGSIVVERPDATPFVAAIADQVAATCEADLRERLAQRIAAELGMELRPDRLTAEEEALASTLQRDRYDSDAFTRMR
jgi:lipoate-protein ligase A